MSVARRGVRGVTLPLMTRGCLPPLFRLRARYIVWGATSTVLLSTHYNIYSLTH